MRSSRKCDGRLRSSPKVVFTLEREGTQLAITLDTQALLQLASSEGRE